MISTFKNITTKQYSLKEEAGRLEKAAPLRPAEHDLIGDGHATLEFVHHDALIGRGHIERGVLLRIGGRYDRHQMVAILCVDARIPHRKAEIDRIGLFEQHRMRPLPAREHQEEFVHQRGGRRIRI